MTTSPAMTTQPRRRWLRFAFSLRAMFVVVTIFGIWLGWQVKIVRERRAILAEIQRIDEGELNETYLPLTLDGYDDDSGYYEYTRVSLVRRLLGDDSYVTIKLPTSIDSQWIDRVEAAFPEAILAVVGPTSNGRTHYEFRDSLYRPAADRDNNRGKLFKTGLIEKSPEGQGKP